MSERHKVCDGIESQRRKKGFLTSWLLVFHSALDVVFAAAPCKISNRCLLSARGLACRGCG